MIIKDLLFAILQKSGENQYPDIHLNTGLKPMVRNTNGDIIPLDTLMLAEVEEPSPILTKEMMKNLILEIVGYNGMDIFMENFELDTSYLFNQETRYRVNCYIDSNGFCVAMRRISSDIPSMEYVGF